MDTRISRHSALGLGGAAALILAMHKPLALTALAGEGRSGVPSGMPADARILKLSLRTSADLEVMRAFYGDSLGLGATRTSERQLVVQAGATEITFTHEAAKTGEHGPYYHYAFNIPENKIRGAEKWQAARTELVVTPQRLRDPAYSKFVRHFVNWNAHSVFFLDPAGNILEYIARHELNNARGGDEEFDSKDILYASEIAFASADVPATAKVIQDALDLPTYKSSSEVFHAIGDERGLLLVFAIGRMMIGDRTAQVFESSAHISADRDADIALPDAPHVIRASAG